MNLQTEIQTELWAAVRRSYETQAWSNAILDGIYYLSDVIRNRTGLQSDGTALAGQALGGKTPKLRLNKLRTQSDISIQGGVEQLLRGLYQAIRNPRSHDRVEDSQRDADALLVFINYLLGVVGHARAAFSLEGAVTRVLDEDFVPNARYAELVVDDIPPRQLLQVALASFERRDEGKHERLFYFFQATLDRLSPDDRTEFFASISEELESTSGDDSLRSVLQILNAEQWPELSEAARLRSENRLLKDFENGKYNPKTRRCTGGALASWALDFWPHFSLKSEFLEAAAALLSSPSNEARDYIAEFGFHSLSSLAVEPSWRLQSAVAERIRNGDQTVYLSVKHELLWKLSSWKKIVHAAMAVYEKSEGTQEAKQRESSEGDDIPF